MRLPLQNVVPSFWPQAERWFNRFCKGGEQWLRHQTDESHQCRECGRRVELFTEICPYCGVANPIRISTTLGAAVGALALASLGLAALLI